MAKLTRSNSLSALTDGQPVSAPHWPVHHRHYRPGWHQHLISLPGYESCSAIGNAVRRGASRALGLVAFAATLLSATVVHGAPAPVSELPTKWQVPPGDRLEHETAGFAKILCSAIFITGRDLKTAADEDGFFVSPPASRAKVVNTVVDRDAQEVRLTLANGVTRSARARWRSGLRHPTARRRESVLQARARCKSALPDAATQDWPMGDRLPDLPLPPEIDKAKLEAAVAAAFDPQGGAHRGVRGRLQGAARRRTLPRWTRLQDAAAELVHGQEHHRDA